MSWLSGVFSFSPPMVPLPPAPRDTAHVFERPGVRVMAAGPDATCLHGTCRVDDEDVRWWVVGLGLRLEGDGCRMLDRTDWAMLLSEKRPRLSTIDGHFAAIRWGKGSVEVFTDRLGLRPVYLRSLPDRLLLATRLDLLVTTGGAMEVDWAAFGAHWLALNAFAGHSLVQGVTRLGQGGYARFDLSGILTTTEQPFDPFTGPLRPDPVETLGALTRPMDASVSLGLSGGLDSRLLLALRLAADAPPATHVFGHETHPDVVVSTRIARRLGLKHTHYSSPSGDPDTLWQQVSLFCRQKNAGSPASAALSMGPYEPLFAAGHVVIDGGLGEIGRRRYLNRLVARGLDGIVPGNVDLVLPWLRLSRPACFQPEVFATMETGLVNDLRQLWMTLPHAGDVNPGMMADLIMVRSRFPFLAAYEQARLDAFGPNYMPFAAATFVQAVLTAPLSLRQGGRLYRRAIRRLYPALTRFPLVKGDAVYPYRLPQPLTTGWVMARGRMVGRLPDAHRAAMLHALRTPILDLLHASNLPAIYRLDVLRDAAARFYTGNEDGAGLLDWWLAVELWRRSLTRI